MLTSSSSFPAQILSRAGGGEKTEAEGSEKPPRGEKKICTRIKRRPFSHKRFCSLFFFFFLSLFFLSSWGVFFLFFVWNCRRRRRKREGRNQGRSWCSSSSSSSSSFSSSRLRPRLAAAQPPPQPPQPPQLHRNLQKLFSSPTSWIPAAAAASMEAESLWRPLQVRANVLSSRATTTAYQHHG